MNSKLWLLMLGNLVVGSGSLVIAGILSPISQDLGVSVASAGQLMTVYALAFALGAPVMAVLLGAWCRKRVLVMALGLFAFASALGAAAPNFEILMISRVLSGIAAAMFSPNAAAVATLLVEPSQRGRAIALVFGGFTLATVFGVPLGTYLGLHIGWRETLMVVSLATMLVLILIAHKLPSQLQMPPANLRSWLLLGQDRKVISLFGVSFLQIAGTYVLFSFMGPFLAARIHASPDQIAWMLMLFGAAGVVGNALSGRAVDRFGAASVASFNIAMVMLGLGVIYVAGHSVWLMGLGIALWGGSVFSINTAQQARLVAHNPQLTAAMLPANSSALFGGQALGSISGGASLSQLNMSGFDALPVMGLAFAGFALLISLRTTETPKQLGDLHQAKVV
jgi:predicted MFS family arabinose efflux permease